MFTGIIQALGHIKTIEPKGGDCRLTIATGKLPLSGAALGDSIAVSGVCLTAVELGSGHFVADVSNETLSRTVLGQLKPGAVVNLELALTPTTRLGGHIVSGHVDGVGTVIERKADARSQRFVIEAPVDGFGDPRIYLSLLRQVCSNGAIGYSRAFRSDIRMGQDVMHTLERALMQFDHDEGFSALRQRFDSAQKSWASLRETLLLQKTLARLLHAGLLPLPDALIRLDRLAGDLHGLYGLANLDSMTAKRQRILPARCRVYDLLNFASEMATHHARPEGRMRLQAYIGSLVSDEYDLEGTAEKVPQFMDLFANLN